MERALDVIDAVGLGLRSWQEALAEIRDLSEARTGQLMGIGCATASWFDWSSETRDWPEIVEAGVLDIQINSRRRRALYAPLLSVSDERDFETERDASRHQAYGDFLRRGKFFNGCVSPVARSGDVTIALAATGLGEGALSSTQRDVFLALAKRVRHAVRTQETFQRQGLSQLMATFEQLSQTVFVCAGDGRLLACTPGGESLLAAGRGLRLASGRLTATSRVAADWLSKTLGQAVGEDRSLPLTPGFLRSDGDEWPIILEVVPVPNIASDFWGSPSALIVARELDPAREATRLARLGAVSMGFTATEEAVARDLLAGRSPRQTAAALGIAVGTVRVHIRNLYAKAGTNSQLGFAALMGALK